jgi:hypothetical protein
MDVVLQRDGNAMQRTPDLSPGALLVKLVGFLERLGIHGNSRMQLVVVDRNALEVLLNQSSRRDTLLPESLLHLRNGGFDNVELTSLAVCWWNRDAGEDQEDREGSHTEGL